MEEKPEVRKAGGVYYTPRYIVDYIVKNTLGKLLNPGLTTPSLEGELKGVRDSISLDSDVTETIQSNPVLGLPTDASGTNIIGLTTPSLEGELKGVRDSISLDSDVGDSSTARCRSQNHDHGLPASAARLSLNPGSNTNQDPPPSSPSLRPKEGLEGVVNAHIAIEEELNLLNQIYSVLHHFINFCRP